MKASKEFNHKYSWEYPQEVVWSFGQKIGSYEVCKDEIGHLSWGFLVDEFARQTVRCNANSKTWESVGRSYFGVTPRRRHVEVTIQ